MKEYREKNKIHWDIAADVHMQAPKGIYDIEGFKQGKSSLDKITLEELGDVKGKKILHLLCHIGLDTLSLARMGADVVGVDISSKAIGHARDLAKEIGVDARFICSDVYNIQDYLDEKFDIVFMSIGVTCWIDDWEKLMSIVSSYMKPDGFYWLYDGHPVSMCIRDSSDGLNKIWSSNYFDRGPRHCEPSGDYADPEIVIEATSVEWAPTLGDIINGIGSTDLKIEYLNEFPYIFPFHDGMKPDSDGYWRPKNGFEHPLMFSIKARKIS